MSLSGLLRHRATIQRLKTVHESDGSLDPFGHQDDLGQRDDPYVTIADNVPCRLESLNAVEKITARSMGIVDEMFTIYFDRGVDVAEADRVSSVVDSDGEVLAQTLDLTGVRKITGGNGRIHHIESSAYVYREGVNISWQA